MRASLEGINLIKSYESLKLKAYLPTPNDVWTIGYGTTVINGRPVHEGMEITKHQANLYFVEDLTKFERVVNKYVKVKLTQNQFDALVSFVYNIGEGNFRRSTLLRKLNDEDYVGAKEEFKRWNKQAGKVLRGLTRRRESEAKLFGRYLNNDIPDKDVEEQLKQELSELEEVIICQTEKSE